MLDFQQKRKARSIAYNKITIVILIMLVLVGARSTWLVYQKKVSSEEMKNESLKNVENLRLRDEELKQKIDRLKTKEGIEEEIRLKYNVVKEEENMVVVVEDEKTEVATTSSKVSFWQKFMNLFK